MPLEPADVFGDHARVQFHRSVARAEETGRAGSHAAALRGEVERHVIGHLAIAAAQLAGQHRAEIGIFQVRLIAPAAHHQLAPPPWSPLRVFSERMMQVCFIRLAICGINSEMWMPGTEVGIARNGPPVGAPGLGSHVSS